MAEKIDNFNLQNFMSQMKFGARNNQFLVDLTFPQSVLRLVPNAGAIQDKFRFKVRSTAIPDAENGNIPLKFRNQTFNIPGDKTFGTWPITIINDTDFAIRDIFEIWSDSINGNTEGDMIEVDDPTELMYNGQVIQLDKNSYVLKEYDMMGAWPLSVGAINLSYDSGDEIETFDVNLQYQIWEARTTRNRSDGTTFNQGGSRLI